MERDRMDRTLLKKSMGFTFLWGLFAHAYGFLNFTISHDSLEAFYSGEEEIVWKISLGRCFVPVYRILTRGLLTMPWLIGVLALLWIGGAVYFIAELFQKRSGWFLILISGLMVVNPVVTSLTATFIHDLDVDMFALLMMVIAVYLWRNQKRGFLLGIPLIAFGLGLYQSYVSVAIVLICECLIMDLLEGKKGKEVIGNGRNGIFMLVSGGILYLVCVRVICGVLQLSVNDSYNSISQIGNLSIRSLLRGVFGSYYFLAENLLQPVSILGGETAMCLVNVLLFLCAGGVLFWVLLRKGMGAFEKTLLILLGFLLPTGVNLSYILSGGILHTLMTYAACLVYGLALLIVEWYVSQMCEKKPDIVYLRKIMTALTLVVLWNDILVSNAAYLKKDVERQQMLSLMTRVVSEIETREDYVGGVDGTPLAFVGKIEMREMPGFEMFSGDGRTSGLNGLNERIQIKNYRDYGAYFQYILNEPVKLCGEAQCRELEEHEAVRSMPVFPEKGSIKMVEGILVVKMGNSSGGQNEAEGKE